MIERLITADAALAEGRFRDAEGEFAQVAAFDPKNAMARVGLARVSLALGRWAEARVRLDEALALDPDDDLARRLHAELEAHFPTADGAAGQRRPSRPVLGRPGEMPRRRGLLSRLFRRD